MWEMQKSSVEEIWNEISDRETQSHTVNPELQQLLIKQVKGKKYPVYKLSHWNTK